MSIKEYIAAENAVAGHVDPALRGHKEIGAPYQEVHRADEFGPRTEAEPDSIAAMREEFESLNDQLRSMRNEMHFPTEAERRATGAEVALKDDVDADEYKARLEDLVSRSKDIGERMQAALERQAQLEQAKQAELKAELGITEEAGSETRDLLKQAARELIREERVEKAGLDNVVRAGEIFMTAARFKRSQGGYDFSSALPSDREDLAKLFGSLATFQDGETVGIYYDSGEERYGEEIGGVRRNLSTDSTRKIEFNTLVDISDALRVAQSTARERLVPLVNRVLSPAVQARARQAMEQAKTRLERKVQNETSQGAQ